MISFTQVKRLICGSNSVALSRLYSFDLVFQIAFFFEEFVTHGEEEFDIPDLRLIDIGIVDFRQYSAPEREPDTALKGG
jgi:hypothetical protein